MTGRAASAAPRAVGTRAPVGSTDDGRRRAGGGFFRGKERTTRRVSTRARTIAAPGASPASRVPSIRRTRSGRSSGHRAGKSPARARAPSVSERRSGAAFRGDAARKRSATRTSARESCAATGPPPAAQTASRRPERIAARSASATGVAPSAAVRASHPAEMKFFKYVAAAAASPPFARAYAPRKVRRDANTRTGRRARSRSSAGKPAVRSHFLRYNSASPRVAASGDSVAPRARETMWSTVAIFHSDEGG